MFRKEKRKKRKPAAIFHKCLVPFRMLLVQLAAGVLRPWRDGALWLISLQGSDQWRGQPSDSGGTGGDLWPIPCKPNEGESWGHGTSDRKGGKDRTVFVLPRATLNLFPLPSCFLLPGASWRHLPGYFSRREEGQTIPTQWD